MIKVIIYTLGRTVSGKTTISKSLSEDLNFIYISEGMIKRSLITNQHEYQTQDSLNEFLRDKGYKRAIELCASYLKENKNVILDASFHKLFRRNWLYQMANELNAFLICIYTICENIDKIKTRINKRRNLPKNANTQADSMSIYYHIDKNFDEPNDEEFKNTSACLIKIDTDLNLISRILKHNLSKEQILFINLVINQVKIYLNTMKKSINC